jgi:hypothetical protein
MAQLGFSSIPAHRFDWREPLFNSGLPPRSSAALTAAAVGARTRAGRTIQRNRPHWLRSVRIIVAFALRRSAWVRSDGKRNHPPVVEVADFSSQFSKGLKACAMRAGGSWRRTAVQCRQTPKMLEVARRQKPKIIIDRVEAPVTCRIEDVRGSGVIAGRTSWADISPPARRRPLGQAKRNVDRLLLR